MPTIFPRSLIGTPEPPATRSKPGAVRYLLGHFTGVGLPLTSRYRSAADADVIADARTVAQFGISSNRPWEYNWIIGLNGWVFVQAGEYLSAHCLNFNAQSKAVLFLNAIGVPLTPAQIDAFRELRHDLVLRGELHPDHHADPHYMYRTTGCPGAEIATPPGSKWNSPTGQGQLGQLRSELLRPWTPPAPPPATVDPPVEPDPAPILEEDDMKPRMWRHADYQNVFLIGSGPAINVTPELAKSYANEGVDIIVERHPQMLKGCMHQAGLDETDLLPWPA